MNADPELHEAVVERLRKRAALEDLGLDRVDGRWDLRGLTLRQPTVTHREDIRLVGDGEHEISRIAGVTELEAVSLADLDLREAKLASLMLTGCEVRNCLFDGAAMDGFSSFGSSFEQCSFASASLDGAVLGGKHRGRGSRYERVSFRAAVMTEVIPGSASFTDCDFSGARLKGAEFLDANLTRCRFRGRVERVIFAGRRPVLGLFGHEETLIDVDFSEATFRWVEFRGLNLDRVVLPSDDDHILVRQPRCVLDRLSAQLRRDDAADPDERGFAELVEAEREWLGPRQSQLVFAVSDLAGTPEWRERAVAMIGEAAAACVQDPARDRGRPGAVRAGDG